MIEISVYKQSNFPVSAAKIKAKVKSVLKDHGIVSDFSLSLAFVGQEKMDSLVAEFYKDDPEGLWDHPILTFPNSEVKGAFLNPPKTPNDLGEIIICFPSVISRANESGKLVEEVALDLVEHGCLHLLGKHHD